MSDIVERLREIVEGDHERLCQGREYACTCGYDQRTLNAAKEATAEIERLRGANQKHYDAGYAHGLAFAKLGRKTKAKTLAKFVMTGEKADD